ncbi:DNA oxidative demethylase AlkB [Comamonas sp. NLF-1-9]|uniref:DNA oxidative demethylase AlkB n=1 Tax=Comamonas sp. NLF-1-9 TaxID=2853163 RepID=UPI001C490640|nr:DNA oxidative demethylase AlkB [Comamonas sp. NLF-1-9]QXL84395.1 DNA oxidative demethylase AlkB [Comamonas sp. NLF-1-9]
MTTTPDLFADDLPLSGSRTPLGASAVVLRGFALARVDVLWPLLQAIVAQAPFRHMMTPGGLKMSVPLTSCGPLGWTSSRAGYRYQSTDPASGRPWPAMPAAFAALARDAAAEAGFAGFTPDACLINRYLPGARLTLHQDKNERDFSQPIVSVSLGVPAVFLWGGLQRGARTQRVPLFHGDVAVWGGADRLRYHGIAPLRESAHPLTGKARINITFRKAGPA